MIVVSVPNFDASFDDAATIAMGAAFDRACRSLRAFGAASNVREIIARRIIEVARQGERDPARLHDRALEALGIEETPFPLESERKTGRWVAYVASGLFASIMLLHAIAG